jgi:hypothetical protein
MGFRVLALLLVLISASASALSEPKRILYTERLMQLKYLYT